MKEITDSNRYHPGRIFCLFFFITILQLSSVFAQDFKNTAGLHMGISTTILSISGNVSSDRMSISYNGLSNGSRLLFQSDKRSGFEMSDLSGEVLNGSDAEKSAFQVDGKLKQMAHYFLNHIKVDKSSILDEEPDKVLKEKVNMEPMNSFQINPDDTRFNLSFRVGYETGSIVKMDAIILDSCWHRMSINAVYHPGRKEVEFGLSSAYINDFLFDGMKLELQANPVTAKGAVLLTMDL